MQSGADDYLVKPFSARELLARVGARVEIARARRESTRRERELRAEAQAARDQLEQVLAGISDQFLALDEEWRYVFANEHVTRVTGLSREQLIGRSIWALYPGLEGSPFEQELRRAAADQTPVHFEYYYPDLDRWFENRVYPAPSGLALFVADITARKRAELNTQFLLDVGETLAYLQGAETIMATLSERVGRFFDADRCAFVEFDRGAETAAITYDWRKDQDEPSFVGAYHVPDFISDGGRRLLTAGRPLAVDDVATDPRTAGALARHQALGIGSYLNTPVVSDHVLRFALVLYRRAPHRWHDEIAPLRELAARIWTRIEHVRAEEALRASEAKLQSALDGGRLGAWSWDPATNTVEADRRALELFAIEPAAFPGDAGPLFERIHPDDGPAVLAALQSSAQAGGIYEAEFRVLWPDGQLRWLTGAGRGRLGPDGRVARIYGVNADITDRKRAEAALREVHERRLAEEQAHAARLQRLNVASLAVNAAPSRAELLERIIAEACAVLDARRAVVTLIPGGDWARAEALGATVADGVATVERLEILDGATLARRVCDERRAIRLTAEEPGALGPDDPGESMLAAPLLGRDGSCLAVLQLYGEGRGAFGAADEALLQQLAQIAAVALENRTLYEQERAARAEAEEASRLKDEFLATVSHELRTPLTALLGYAQLLQSRKRDEAYVARTVERIVRSARAQAQITEDLLDVARIVSGKLRIEPRPLDLLTVVEAAVETIRPTVEAKGQRLLLDLQPDAGAVIGDAGRLQQVVWNLLSNATKFTPPGGRVAVLLERAGREARLTVSDSGQGISPAFLPFIFERFRQADSSSQRSQNGLGLGLSIVRHLVELHGGTVTAHSSGAGEGATFTVLLPTSARGPADLLPHAPDEADGEHCPPELRGLRVLVVDDQPDILDLLGEMLLPCAVAVRSCDSARAAYEALRSWRPDILVSDIAMPGEDGYWLIRAVRELPPEAGGATPAVALTAYVRMEDRLRVLKAGYQQYVPKPVEPAELRAVLASVVRADTVV
jgi:PAS domain S-box-containing protein